LVYFVPLHPLSEYLKDALKLYGSLFWNMLAVIAFWEGGKCEVAEIGKSLMILVNEFLQIVWLPSLISPKLWADDKFGLAFPSACLRVFLKRLFVFQWLSPQSCILGPFNYAAVFLFLFKIFPLFLINLNNLAILKLGDLIYTKILSDHCLIIDNLCLIWMIGKI